ncbi:probable LysR-family transcriptional activator [Oceanicola granulosus HTCC2516]|uniref:Probable LysR-family transcriptional activator n=1 Tax=Oceanicola granulosus (strain ATCC BAA-861 / DSM 15982 / KCTC 12143 / HTCC2516) TaxID=314256 RepID=Q2CFB8_OCEGH|nr:LysR substrate-binding domain-containing protein [Oceanicola granulosus]EAR51377.1 probable LysR-family transcriptional activator [Oceanicola granulosus HTCC2516]
MPRPYDLPSLTALSCFEAAARHLGFKSAARELNVTPAAVSHQIKALEADLGVRLFRRQHRGVELTETGAYLFVALQRGFEGISEAVRDVRAPAEAEDVIVQATTAVSAFWLTPQIAQFWKSHPEIVVSQIVSDAAAPAGRADLAIHYGPPPAGEAGVRLLFHDEIVAVAAPGFAAEHGVADLAGLAAAPLIHMAAEDTDWTGWPDWLAALGGPAPSGRRIAVNNHMIALQLARDGAGAVLGWTGLIGPLLEGGALVSPVPERLASPHPFHLRTHPRASAKALAFRDWLVAAQAEGGPG